jgi:hypothetical protein
MDHRRARPGLGQEWVSTGRDRIVLGTGRKRRAFLAVAQAVVGLTLAASPALSSTSFRQTSADLCRASEAVVFGEIVGLSVKRDANGVPWTRYQLQVTALYAGEFDGNVLEFDCIGGAIDGETIIFGGVPGFSTGERVLLFYDDDDAQCPIAGGERGAFTVSTSIHGFDTITALDGRAIAGFSNDEVVAQSIRIPRMQSSEVSAAIAAVQAQDAPIKVESDRTPPPLALDALLAEFEQFAAHHVTRPKKVTSRTRTFTFTPVRFEATGGAQ